jgi:type IV pilus assembly protein PilO
MADVNQTRRKLTVAFVVMLCLDVLCVILLLSPIGRGAREGRQTVNQLWDELKTKTKQAEPLHGLDSKIVEAKAQIKDFYVERFPQNFAAVPERLNKLAAANGVTLSSAKYSTDDTDIPGLRAIRIEAAIDGDYIKEAKFINAVERDKTFFIIDSVALGEQQKGGVHLQIVFETYVRSQAAS